MKYLVLCVTLVLLFFINTAYSTVTISPYYNNEKLKVVNFVLKQSFKLACNITKDEGEDLQVKWIKNGTALANKEGKYKISNLGATYILEVLKAEEVDAGIYTCAAYQDDNQVQAANLTAASEFLIKVPTNQNVVEGETLTIHCSTMGSPVPHLHWLYVNETYNITIYEPTGRYNVSSEKGGTPNSMMIIEDVQMYDRGKFYCIGTHEFALEQKNSSCMIRVKDQYAALWPFLGICVEVFVLCAVIFIYEKKRNKTELEESDTDQSPDQKNTPDHGKESNLRHRQ